MPREALRTILPIAGWPAERADTVTISDGTDPVLPTPFRIGTAGAATLAATGLAAADLWEIRSGRRQNVSVDFRHASASLRSGHYMKLGDGQVSPHATRSWASIRPRTAAGAICTATSPTIAPPRSAYSASPKIVRQSPAPC